MYISTAADGGYGSNELLATAWKYKWLADFAVYTAHPVEGRQNNPSAAATEKIKFYRLHKVVAAPALVVFWPANNGEKSSGTLNAHSLNTNQIQLLMNKVNAKGQKKRGKHSRVGTGLGSRGSTDGKGDELPWSQHDTARMVASELVLGRVKNTLNAPTPQL